MPNTLTWALANKFGSTRRFNFLTDYFSAMTSSELLEEKFLQNFRRFLSSSKHSVDGFFFSIGLADMAEDFADDGVVFTKDLEDAMMVTKRIERLIEIITAHAQRKFFLIHTYDNSPGAVNGSFITSQNPLENLEYAFEQLSQKYDGWLTVVPTRGTLSVDHPKDWNENLPTRIGFEALAQIVFTALTDIQDDTKIPFTGKSAVKQPPTKTTSQRAKRRVKRRR